MSKKDGKDTILSLYTDIVEEIKSNEKYRNTKSGKLQLKDYERQLKGLKKAMYKDGMPQSEMKNFTSDLENQINSLSGKDYYFTVNDGFKSYKMMKSKIEKKGDKAAAYMLRIFAKNVTNAATEIKNDKSYSDAYKRKMSDAYRRLLKNINRNLRKLQRKKDYDYDDYYDNMINRKAYPIFQNINLTSIRINI